MANTIETEGKMTLEEFFEWQSRQDDPYELLDGVPVPTWKAMTGATRRHDIVLGNVFANLHFKLRGGPCRPHTDDQSVLTDRGTRRPDVIVECGEHDDGAMASSEPRVVVEVLSPSNGNIDFMRKLEEYRRTASIKVILVVETWEPKVAVWRRDGDDWMFDTIEGRDAAIPLPEIDTELLLSEIYDAVELPEA